MKKIIFGLVALMMSTFQLTSCAQAKTNANVQKKMNEKKVLVVFYSRAGQNYSVGNVAVGNTQKLAEMIAEAAGADTFQIKPVKEYPADYTECTEVAKTEKETNARPAVKDDIRVEDYDVIFLGYPNWWSDAPMPVYTFIEKHDWTGKTVIPFCTHEGSGLSNRQEIASALKGATVLDGFDLYGHVAQKASDKTKAEVKVWVDALQY